MMRSTAKSCWFRLVRWLTGRFQWICSFSSHICIALFSCILFCCDLGHFASTINNNHAQFSDCTAVGLYISDHRLCCNNKWATKSGEGFEFRCMVTWYHQGTSVHHPEQQQIATSLIMDISPGYITKKIEYTNINHLIVYMSSFFYFRDYREKPTMHWVSAKRPIAKWEIVWSQNVKTHWHSVNGILNHVFEQTLYNRPTTECPIGGYQYCGTHSFIFWRSRTSRADILTVNLLWKMPRGVYIVEIIVVEDGDFKVDMMCTINDHDRVDVFRGIVLWMQIWQSIYILTLGNLTKIRMNINQSINYIMFCNVWVHGIETHCISLIFLFTELHSCFHHKFPNSVRIPWGSRSVHTFSVNLEKTVFRGFGWRCWSP